jgi:hypothetical protein
MKQMRRPVRDALAGVHPASSATMKRPQPPLAGDLIAHSRRGDRQ